MTTLSTQQHPARQEEQQQAVDTGAAEQVERREMEQKAQQPEMDGGLPSQQEPPLSQSRGVVDEIEEVDEIPSDDENLDEIPADEDFRALFEASIQESAPLDRGQLVDGVVVSIEGDQVIINVGGKGEGAVPAAEFASAHLPVPALNESVEVMVTDVSGTDGVQLSVLDAIKLHQWIVVESALADGSEVDAHILSEIKGGFRVTIGGLQAFMPRSEADASRHLQSDLLVGTDCKVVVLDASRRPENVVVSRRRPMEVEMAAKRQRFFEQHQVGDRVTGVVRRLVDYGAFVDLGGADALLHVSDIAWRRLTHPSDVLTTGQTITAEITSVDAEKGRVSISMKQLLEDPWLRAAGSYSKGMRVTGSVRRLLDFGAVVELEPGIDGLIHNSELSWTRRDVKPSSILAEGDVVDLSVLEVDPERRRIRLSLKEVLENPWQTWLANHPVGSRVAGRVKNITEFGFFVGLSAELDGLVHIGNLTWTGDADAALAEYQKGQEVECVVLGVDVERQRVSLGIKQLQDDPFTLFLAGAKEGGSVTGKVIEVAGWGYIVEVADGVRARLS
ncbi:MAG: S1 RNA-binding domain-containing protein, partial [Mariprofundales bacterium]|nr:S1 RNA-binding domain-containing protein [Mariprofundales bacterium]